MNFLTRHPQWPHPVGPRDVPMDNVLRYRAQSILHGLVDDPLPETVDEARDVLAWAYASEQAPRKTIRHYADRRGF